MVSAAAGFSLSPQRSDGFAANSEIIDYIAAYADFVAPPLAGVAVTRLRRADGAAGFIAETSDGVIAADNVVVATGPYQRPVVPALSRDIDVFQVHASGYKNPKELPPGAVLVAGSGASGAQIAEELNRAGRRVYLSVGRHTRLPRRYRGADIIWWLSTLGIDQTPVEERGPSRLLPVISGAHGGNTIDFRRFAADGVTLLGRVAAVREGVIEFAPDLAESLANGDATYAAFLDRVDAHIERHGLDMPEDPAARAVKPGPRPDHWADPAARDRH